MVQSTSYGKAVKLGKDPIASARSTRCSRSSATARAPASRPPNTNMRDEALRRHQEAVPRAEPVPGHHRETAAAGDRDPRRHPLLRRRKKINIHFRNIRGRRDDFQEVFPDEGTWTWSRSCGP